MKYRLKIVEFKYKEIAAQLYIPDTLHVKELHHKKNTNKDFPYWSKIWPAAFAMAEFIIDNAHYVKNKKVVELAAGLALPTMVVAKFAKFVCYSDLNKDAVDIAALSVKQNKLANVSGKIIDWKKLQHPLDAEVVLLSDINYEPENFDELYNVIVKLLAEKILVILSTPHRLLAKPFIEKLTPLIIQQENIDIIENNLPVNATVFVLQLL